MKCPKLKTKGHARWSVRQELPAGADGGRRMFRRGGFEVKDDAQDALDRVRALLALATDEDDARHVGDMLDALGKNEVLPEVETVQRKLRSGQDLVENLTISEWLDRWMAQETHRKATERYYEQRVRLYLKPKLGHVRVDRLTVGHLAEAFASISDDNDRIMAANADRRALVERITATSSRAEKRALREQLADMAPFRRPVGASSQARIHATLRAAMNDAISQQLTTFNAAMHYTVSAKSPKALVWTSERVEEWRRTGQRPGPVMVWTPAQAGVFLDWVAEHDQEYEALWHLAVMRGPRRGELAGLPWTEVDLAAGSVTISTQLVEVGWEVIEGDPKSTAGERKIPLDTESVRLLRAHKARQSAERLRLGPAWVVSRRVFTRPDGSPLRPSTITDRFMRLSAEAGLPPIRLHDVRHTAATLMLAAGVDMKVIQETLGHSQLQVTANLYTSVLPELAREAAEATAAVVPRTPRRKFGHPSGTLNIGSITSEEGGTAGM
jgi:integrase